LSTAKPSRIHPRTIPKHRRSLSSQGESCTTTLATHSFSPAAGTYPSAQTVTISDAANGTTIYYTTNGTTPTTSSTKYTGPITVGSSETVEAIAVATSVSGWVNSATGSAAYTITSPNCSATYRITPYIAVGGVWNTTSESTVTVPSATTSVDLGPWPQSGGSWSWTGPNGFTSTSREIDNIALPATTNTYTATYTFNGTSYTQAFIITVN
jgi:hypothetical protein